LINDDLLLFCYSVLHKSLNLLQFAAKGKKKGRNFKQIRIPHPRRLPNVDISRLAVISQAGL
jgi:hypothetical protein